MLLAFVTTLVLFPVLHTKVTETFLLSLSRWSRTCMSACRFQVNNKCKSWQEDFTPYFTHWWQLVAPSAPCGLLIKPDESKKSHEPVTSHSYKKDWWAIHFVPKHIVTLVIGFQMTSRKKKTKKCTNFSSISTFPRFRFTVEVTCLASAFVYSVIVGLFTIWSVMDREYASTGSSTIVPGGTVTLFGLVFTILFTLVLPIGGHIECHSWPFLPLGFEKLFAVFWRIITSI